MRTNFTEAKVFLGDYFGGMGAHLLTVGPCNAWDVKWTISVG